MQLTGHTAMQGASVQCMHATETDFSPASPWLSVTTLRRLTPQGTSFSFLHATAQALQSMQRSTSQRNRILAMGSGFRDLTEAGLALLHHGHGVVAVGPRGVHRLAYDVRCRALRVLVADVFSLPPTGEVVGHPDHPAADARRQSRAHLDARARGRRDPDEVVLLQAAIVGVGRIDLAEHL